MNGAQENVKVDRVLEYIIFSSGTLRLFKGDNGLEFEIQLVEIYDQHFLAEVVSGPKEKLKDPEMGSLQAKTGFKGKFLTFDTSVLQFSEVEGSETQFTFSMPNSGILTNQRKHPRLKFPNLTESIRAEIEIKSTGSSRKFVTTHFVDFSAQGVSFFIDRTQGLILPNDVVTSFSLFQGNELILKTQGKVLRVDVKRQSKKAKNTFLAVIIFDHNNRNETGDSNRRRIERSNVVMRPGNFVELVHPLFPQKKLNGQISDISTSGISFIIYDTKYPILPGLMINEFTLRLQGEESHTTAIKIANCREVMSGDELTVRIGAEFIGMSVEMLKGIRRTIDQTGDGDLSDATFEDQELLWEFFFETGFIYTQKRKQIQEYAPKLLDTYKRLLSSDSTILRKILLKEDGEIRGHLSAIKFFDHSWVVQHLNALPISQKSASQSVFDAMVHFFLDSDSNQKTETNYIVWYYQPSNLYSATLFDHIKSYINQPDICNSFDLDFCLKKSESTSNSPDQDIDCKEAEESDLQELEYLLMTKEYWDDIRTENLRLENFTDLKVEEEYKRQGLYRYRKVFVAQHPTSGEKAFAVCNYSSPGLNLSELTNSMRFFFTSENEEINQYLINELSEYAYATYTDTDMPSPVLLLEEGQPIPATFKKVKSYRKWYINTDHMGLFKSAKEEIFSQLSSLIKKRIRDSRQIEQAG